VTTDTPDPRPVSPFRQVVDDLTGGCGCGCHTGIGYNSSCEHCRPVSPPSELTAAIAEGLHKAMCFGPTTLHNRLACERPQVYLAIAEAAVEHPAVRELLDAQYRSTEAAFGALSAVGDDLLATLDAARAAPQADAGLREAMEVLCYAAEDVVLQRAGQWRTSGKALTALDVATKAAHAALAAAPVVPAGLDVETLRQALVNTATMHEDLRATPTAEAQVLAAEYDRLRADPR
jgi:hypothetical protein